MILFSRKVNWRRKLRAEIHAAIKNLLENDERESARWSGHDCCERADGMKALSAFDTLEYGWERIIRVAGTKCRRA